jgi:hypothetical protein
MKILGVARACGERKPDWAGLPADKHEASNVRVKSNFSPPKRVLHFSFLSHLLITFEEICRAREIEMLEQRLF